MGCPSVYVLLLLNNEYSCFGQWLSRVKPGKKSEQRYIYKESRGSQGEAMQLLKEKDTLRNLTSLVMIHRLIEVG